MTAGSLSARNQKDQWQVSLSAQGWYTLYSIKDTLVSNPSISRRSQYQQDYPRILDSISYTSGEIQPCDCSTCHFPDCLLEVSRLLAPFPLATRLGYRTPGHSPRVAQNITLKGFGRSNRRSCGFHRVQLQLGLSYFGFPEMRSNWKVDAYPIPWV